MKIFTRVDIQFSNKNIQDVSQPKTLHTLADNLKNKLQSHLLTLDHLIPSLTDPVKKRVLKTLW